MLLGTIAAKSASGFRHGCGEIEKKYKRKTSKDCDVVF